MKRKREIQSGFTIRRRCLSILMAVIMTLGYMPAMAWAAPGESGSSGGSGTRTVGDAPDAEKNLYDNGDGTCTISLSVTGATEFDSTTKIGRANVVLVLLTIWRGW